MVILHEYHYYEVWAWGWDGTHCHVVAHSLEMLHWQAFMLIPLQNPSYNILWIPFHSIFWVCSVRRSRSHRLYECGWGHDALMMVVEVGWMWVRARCIDDGARVCVLWMNQRCGVGSVVTRLHNFSRCLFCCSVIEFRPYTRMFKHINHVCVRVPASDIPSSKNIEATNWYVSWHCVACRSCTCLADWLTD